MNSTATPNPALHLPPLHSSPTVPGMGPQSQATPPRQPVCSAVVELGVVRQLRAFPMKPTFSSYLTLILLLSATAAVLAEARGQDKQETTAQTEAPSPARPSDYIFKAIKIEPSAVDGEYTGHFRFVNRLSKPVRVSGFGEPYHGRFTPRFVGFEVLLDGAWKDQKIGYCGTGAQDFTMKPKVPYEFICGLWAFEEQEAPLTARIRVGDDFISEPFVLDWKRDRASGAFATARKRNFQEVRSAFAKAGFKPELIKGDDFCERLLRAVVKATGSGREDGFAEFKGKLDVTPDIEINGNIRIDFGSEDGEGRENYQGWWVINPNKFNPAWFRKTARRHVKASPWGDGLEMELDDGSAFWDTDVRLYLCIKYVPSDKTVKLPTVEKAKQMSMKMLDNLEQWLK